VPGKERGTNGRRRPGSLEAEQDGNLLLHVMTMGARASGARTSPREMGAKAGSSERDQDRDGWPLNHVDPKIGSSEERIITRKGKK
jgi:hypothetical protein